MGCGGGGCVCGFGGIGGCYVESVGCGCRECCVVWILVVGVLCGGGCDCVDWCDGGVFCGVVFYFFYGFWVFCVFCGGDWCGFYCGFVCDFLWECEGGCD